MTNNQSQRLFCFSQITSDHGVRRLDEHCIALAYIRAKQFKIYIHDFIFVCIFCMHLCIHTFKGLIFKGLLFTFFDYLT